MQTSLFELAKQIKQWGKALGFQQTGITDIDLATCEDKLQQWLANGFHGSMDYMSRHGLKRSRADLLLPGTIRIISVRMDYLPESSKRIKQALQCAETGYISRYALGRDYHKLIRQRLQKLALKIEAVTEGFNYRAFVDSAPVMEKPIAAKAGLGWQGKHTNLINRQAGSWFFLGELYTNIPLPIDTPKTNHCGRCQACLDICPTQAIVAPYQLDARRCISYLTIELQGSIPEALRPLLGNRIYGCDDCQLICPWNKFARLSNEKDFTARHQLDETSLIALFSWTEAEFLKNLEGSAIRRIGHQRWLRNIAVALGNAQPSEAIKQALLSRQEHPSEMVREHINWGLRESYD